MEGVSSARRAALKQGGEGLILVFRKTSRESDEAPRSGVFWSASPSVGARQEAPEVVSSSLRCPSRKARVVHGR
jgi:hypothetical protein